MNRTAARLVEMGAEPPRIIAWGERPGDDAVDFFSVAERLNMSAL